MKAKIGAWDNPASGPKGRYTYCFTHRVCLSRRVARAGR